jgi:hypothetical protein
VAYVVEIGRCKYLLSPSCKVQEKEEFIGKLKVNDIIIMDQEEKEVCSFYNSLLGTVAHRDFSLNLEAFHRPASSLQDLDQAFSKEVWKAIKSLPTPPPDKSPLPGPDGYTGHSYEIVWPIINADFLVALNVILHGDVQTTSPQFSLCDPSGKKDRGS